MENSIKSVAIPYGIYLGVALSLITVIAYAFNLELLTEWWYGIGSFLVLLLIAILAVIRAKSATSERFSFKLAFTAYFIPVLIGTFIAMLVNILLFNVVDPGAAEVVTEKTAEMSREMMQRFGTPEAQIEEAIAEMKNNNQFSVFNLLRTFVFQLAFYSLIGLLVALVFKEKNPNYA